jgi:hypothetical protein
MMGCPVGAKSFRADRQTDGKIEGKRDMKKLTVAFLRFANAPANFGAHFDRPNVRIAVPITQLLAVGPCF